MWQVKSKISGGKNIRQSDSYVSNEISQEVHGRGAMLRVIFQDYRNHHPSSENCVFSTTVHTVDLRPICKFEFVHCGPVEKKQRALSEMSDTFDYLSLSV